MPTFIIERQHKTKAQLQKTWRNTNADL